MINLEQIANKNIHDLENNPYPGRGIIIGMTPDKENMVQIYWIMGRSANSRNRIFETNGQNVRTKAYDESKLEDPSLIIYNAARQYKNQHIVTNGDQTDTIFDFLNIDKTFENALDTRCFEPDAPNLTPRISGIIDMDDGSYSYKLSILKSDHPDQSFPIRQYFTYAAANPGFGHCIHTYENDGNPIPSFKGEPYTVPLFDSISENANFYWDLLNEENKVSLLVKYINLSDNRIQIKIKNLHS